MWGRGGVAYVHIWGATRISPLFLYIFFNRGQMYCLGFSVYASEGGDGWGVGGVGGCVAGRERDEIWLYLGDKGSNSSSYAKKKKGCPVSLDPRSERSLLLLAAMNGRCFMCMCCVVARRTGAFIWGFFLYHNNVHKN